MRSLFRLLPALRTAPTTRAPRREQVSFQLDAQRSIELLRVHDPRAKRIKLSVDERGARLTLPLRASRVEGERFLHEHRGWLAAQLDRQADAAGSGLVRDGTATLPLRGLELPLRWQGGRATRLERDGNGLCFTAPANAGPGRQV